LKRLERHGKTHKGIVAPRTGAWIETRSIVPVNRNVPGRPPHGGVD